MKAYTFITLAIIAALLSPRAGYAATATSTAQIRTEASASADKTKKLEELKDRLATKVAELRQTQRKALFGTVLDVTLLSLTIETPNKNIKLELGDTVKIVERIKDKRTTLSSSDLSKGDTVTVFGEYDPTIDLLRPKIIVIQKKPAKHIRGKIKDVHKTDFSVSVNTIDGQIYTVDIESTTKTLSWTLSGGIVKSGFSKLNTGDTILVSGTTVPKKDLRISADRVINIGSLSSNPLQSTETPAPSTSTPSSTPAK